MNNAINKSNIDEGKTLIQKFIIGLTVFTALSHILFSYGWENDILGLNLGVWFVINGIGYLIILYLVYFDDEFLPNRVISIFGLIFWTLGSIIAWALFHTSSERYTTLLDASLINKSIEFIILILLFLELRSQMPLESP